MSADLALPAWLRPLQQAADLATAERLSPAMPAPPVVARRSAVLMLLGDGGHGPEVLLTERAAGLRSHAGQVSFPGGATDPDDAGPVETALREAGEEVGLDAAGVRVFASLPALWVPPSGFAVTTVLGWEWRPSQAHVVDHAEVASVLRVPVAELLDPQQRFTVQHPSGRRGPAFEVAGGLVVWGFTAGVLSRLFALAGWERPWDRSRLRSLPVVAT